MNDLENILHAGSLAVLEGLGDAVSIQGPDLRILYQNQAHIEMMGAHVGEECFRAYHGKDAACSGCRLLLALREGKTGRWESSPVSKDGRSRRVEIVASPLRAENGTIIAAIEAVRDVTERKLMSEKLNLITSDLEQRTWKLMAANKELESFSYTLSHDIRNYIARISMAAQALREDPSIEFGDSGEFLVTSIDESCNELETLVNSILLLCRSGREVVAREKLDLTALAAEVVDELCLQFPERQVTVEIAAGLVAVGDRHLLKIALKNLFGNAWKYTQNMPQALIRFYSEEKAGETVFVISDNGCGFDMKEAAGLFKPFSRLSSARSFAGSGIGLSTVRRVVQAHDGDVWGQGEAGTGATFYFTLPAKESASYYSPSPVPQRSVFTPSSPQSAPP